MRGLTRTTFCASLPCLPLEMPYSTNEELTLLKIEQQEGISYTIVKPENAREGL